MKNNKNTALKADSYANHNKHTTRVFTATALALAISACGGGNPPDNSQSPDLPLPEVGSALGSQTTSLEPITVDSQTTTGFSAEILEDGSVLLSWIPLSAASMYEIFRDDEILTTTADSQTVVRTVNAGPQAYKVRAILDDERSEVIADGLVVDISPERLAAASPTDASNTNEQAEPNAIDESDETATNEPSESNTVAVTAPSSPATASPSLITDAPNTNTTVVVLAPPAAANNTPSLEQVIDNIDNQQPAPAASNTVSTVTATTEDNTVTVPAPAAVTVAEPATAVAVSPTEPSEPVPIGSGDGGEDNTTAVTTPVGNNEPETAETGTSVDTDDAVDASTPDTTDSAQAPAEAPAAVAETPAVAAANTFRTSFSSHTDEGFGGEVQTDGSVMLRWNSHPGATGYNVFRDSQYYVTVHDTEFHDRAITSNSHYYQVDAFDDVPIFTTIAEGLTVDFTGGGAWDEPRSPELLENSDYQLVFNEEFDGTELNLATWDTSYLWGPDLVINSEEQYYVDIENEPDFGFNPFTVADGILTIESIQTPDGLLDKANGQRYLSGVITSHTAFKFTYGYIEARARLPRGRGFWSAFWLLTAYYVGSRPEIDIMEHIGHDWDWAYHTYHYFDETDTLRSTKSQETVGVDYTNDFHTFGVEWLPGKLVFYVDGIARHTIIDSEVSSQEMYLIANTAIGGWWPGSPDTTTPWPGTHEIDYIRVWQREGQLPLAPQNDDGPGVPRADDLPNRSPNHIPSPSQWPEGYPNLQR